MISASCTYDRGELHLQSRQMREEERGDSNGELHDDGERRVGGGADDI